MKKIQILTTLATLGFLAGSASAATLLVNGGFEDGTLTGWTNNNGGAVVAELGSLELELKQGAFSAQLTMTAGNNGVPEMRQEFRRNSGADL